jgi:DNA ligase (NAD+)
MSPSEAKELSERLTQAEQAYHNGQDPIMTDAEYDAAKRSLQTFYAEHDPIAGVALGKVGAPVDSSYKKVKHIRPMLSLETKVDTSITPIEEFVQKAVEAAQSWPSYDGEIGFVLEHKFDGIALSNRYMQGKLEVVATRGDGIEGEDVTRILKTVDCIPQSIGFLGELEVRGELLLPTESLEQANTYRVLHGQPPYANCRNAVAGIVRMKDMPHELGKLLRFMAYDAFSKSRSFESQYLKMDFLNSQGFITRSTRVSYSVLDGVGESYIPTFYERAEEERANLGYDIDGVVYKVDNIELQGRMGMSNGYPNWAIAHKFEPETAFTELLGIKVQVGRTGRITPMAVLKPVKVGGVEVSSATLHHEDHIKDKDFRIGDTVIVHRAGDVVPEVVGVAIPDSKERRQRPVYSFPDKCPVCGSALLRLPDEKLHYCTGGADCKEQTALRLINAASRTVLNFDGLGEQFITALEAQGSLHNVADFWYLTLADFEKAGISTLVGEKILAVINSRRKSDMWRVIAALGIRLVGPTTAKVLASHIERIDQLVDLTKETLMSLDDIGEGTARSILAYTQSPAGSEELMALGSLGLDLIPSKKVSKSLPLAVVTGSFPGYTRDEVKDMVTFVMGYKVVGGLSSSVKALIVGNNPTKRKVDLAKTMGIQILSDLSFTKF